MVPPSPHGHDATVPLLPHDHVATPRCPSSSPPPHDRDATVPLVWAAVLDAIDNAHVVADFDQYKFSQLLRDQVPPKRSNGVSDLWTGC